MELNAIGMVVEFTDLIPHRFSSFVMVVVD